MNIFEKETFADLPLLYLEPTASNTIDVQTLLKKPIRTTRECIPSLLNESIHGIVIGTFVAVEDRRFLVNFAGNPANGPVAAIAVTEVSSLIPGIEVALSFINNDPSQPLILGTINRLEKIENHLPIPVETDGKRREITADNELILRCGDASITLTKAGKILLKGTYVSSHAKGVNRIKGGSVQVN